MTQELAQLIHLAVRQRVHRVHDNRLDAPTRPRTQDMINDRNDIGQAFTGSGTRRQHIAPAPRSDPYRLFLMPVKPQPPAPNIGLRLVPAEDVASRPMKDTVGNQTVNRATRLERRGSAQPVHEAKASPTHHPQTSGHGAPGAARNSSCTHGKYRSDDYAGRTRPLRTTHHALKSLLVHPMTGGHKHNASNSSTLVTSSRQHPQPSSYSRRLREIVGFVHVLGPTAIAIMRRHRPPGSRGTAPESVPLRQRHRLA